MSRLARKFLVRHSSTCAAKAPKLKFNDGHECPVLGLGTWLSKPGEICGAVKHAIQVGYRHIDTAHVYQNEKEVGDALECVFQQGHVKREDVFVTSKLWNTMHRPEMVEPAIRNTLQDLRLDYVDLYLIHWPFALREGKQLFPTNCDGSAAESDVDYVDTWKAMEEIHKKCLARSIGVSNFNKNQIERILGCAKIIPVTNQVETHAYLTQCKLQDYCSSKKILMTAYSPLGAGGRPGATKGKDPVLLEEPVIKEIAKKYHRTPAQICLRYLVQRGFIVLAKSVKNERIEENFEIWDFELCEEDVACMNGLNKPFRYYPYQNACRHKDHPFTNDEY